MSKTRENKPSLRALSFALRNEETWPEHFDQWDYRFCDTCAVGLALAMWPQFMSRINSEHVSGIFGISVEDSVRIFGRAHKVLHCDICDIKPADVADLIDALEKEPSC